MQYFQASPFPKINGYLSEKVGCYKKSTCKASYWTCLSSTSWNHSAFPPHRPSLYLKSQEHWCLSWSEGHLELWSLCSAYSWIPVVQRRYQVPWKLEIEHVWHRADGSLPTWRENDKVKEKDMAEPKGIITVTPLWQSLLLEAETNKQSLEEAGKWAKWIDLVWESEISCRPGDL